MSRGSEHTKPLGAGEEVWLPFRLQGGLLKGRAWSGAL